MATFGGSTVAALSPLIDLVFPVSALTGYSGTVPDQANNDQPTVETLLKQRMQESEGWNGASGALFAGLPSGVPFVLGLVAKLAEQFTGIDITDWLDQWEALPLVGELPGIVEDALGTIFTQSVNLLSIFGDLNFLDPDFNPTEALTSFIELMLDIPDLLVGLVDGLIPTDLFGGFDASKIISGEFPMEMITGLLDFLDDIPGLDIVTDLIDGLLNGGQPVNVLNLFGQIPSSLFGIIPVQALGGTAPNPLNNGGFDGSISMIGDGVWTFDPAVGRTSAGSAKTTADGTAKALLSNAVDVNPGDKLSPEIWFRSNGYVGTGTPLKLTVRTYLRNTTTGVETPVSTSTIAQMAGPGTTFTKLSGTYTVPTNGTVNRVRLRPLVDTTATAGDIWVDDGNLAKQGFGPFGGVLDMFGLSTLDDLFDIDVSDIWAGIVTAFISPLGLLFGTGDSIPDTNVPGIGGILGEIFGAITGIFTSGIGHTDMTTAVQGQTDAVTGQSAMISQIAAALSPGTPDNDAFERTNSTNLDTGWTQFQTGSGAKLSTSNGHDAVFAINPLTAGEWVAYRTSVFAAGDNQVVEVVFATAPATFGANGYNDLWLRQTNFASFATRTGLCLRYRGDGDLKLYWVNSGAFGTPLFTGTTPLKAVAGTTWRFEAGIGLVPRRFKSYFNGTPIMDSTEVGTTSQYGASYLRRGFGGKSESVLANFMPGNLRSWTASG